MTLLDVIPDEILVSVCSNWLSVADIYRLDISATSHGIRPILINVFQKTTIDVTGFHKIQRYSVRLFALRACCQWILTRNFQIQNGGLAVSVDFQGLLTEHHALRKNDPKASKGKQVKANVADEAFPTCEPLHCLRTEWFSDNFIPALEKLRFITKAFRSLKEIDFLNTLLTENQFDCLGKFVPEHMPHLARISCHVRLSLSYVKRASEVVRVLGPLIVSLKERYSGDYALLRHCVNLESFTLLALEDYELLLHLPNLLVLEVVDDVHDLTENGGVTKAHVDYLTQLRKLNKITFDFFPIPLLQLVLAEMPQVTTVKHERVYMERTDASHMYVCFRKSWAVPTREWDELMASLPPISALKIARQDDWHYIWTRGPNPGGLNPHLQHIRSLIIGRNIVKDFPNILSFLLKGNYQLEEFSCCISFFESRSTINKEERKVLFSDLFEHSGCIKSMPNLEGLGTLTEKEVQQIVSKCPMLTTLGFHMVKRSSPDDLLRTLASKGRAWDLLDMSFLGLEQVIVGMEKFGLLVKKLICKSICYDLPIKYGYGVVPIDVGYLKKEIVRLTQLKQRNDEERDLAKQAREAKKAKKAEAKAKREAAQEADAEEESG